MENRPLLIIVVLLLLAFKVSGQSFAYGDHWYSNPLGFDPVNLHTKNGFIIPAIAAGICLLTTHADSQFVNRISFYNESGISWGYKYPYATLLQNNTGIQYYLRRWMSAGIDIGFYFPSDPFNRTTGISIRPFFRFYPVNNDVWRIYFESGGGIIYFFEQFPKPTDKDPRLGTNWNGTTRYGVGGEISIDRRFAVIFGVRHVHVSNGNTIGVERNPSHDSNGLFIGLSFRPVNSNK